MQRLQSNLKLLCSGGQYMQVLSTCMHIALCFKHMKIDWIPDIGLVGHGECDSSSVGC